MNPSVKIDKYNRCHQSTPAYLRQPKPAAQRRRKQQECKRSAKSKK